MDCGICNSHFGIESQLEIHVKTVHEKMKTIECKFCKATIGHKQNMKRHIKSVREKLKHLYVSCARRPLDKKPNPWDNALKLFLKS